MKTTTIAQTVTFAASPREIYDAYIETKRHAAFTGAKARIVARPGGKMTAWNGYVSGEFLLLRPGTRIVQTWKSMRWPKGDPESILDIRLASKGKGTELTMVHSGIPASPASLANGFKKGWYESYWTPLRKYFAKSRRER